MAAPPTYAPAGFLRGIVKQVLSGDTMIVMGMDSSRGPPPEKQVTLAHLSAPRMGNRNTPDEPFAWRAREFLRTWLIGKPVSFRVDYSNQSGRQFATVLTDDGTNVAAAVVAEGLARVVPPKGTPPAGQAPAEGAASPASQLLELEATALAEHRGMHTADVGAKQSETRAVNYAPDGAALVRELGGQPVTAVVEHVLGGASFKVLLLQGFQHVTLLLAGVQAPSVRRNHETGVEDAQPFAKEARHFSEARVLHRTVRVILGGTDKGGNILGTLLHVTNDINLGVELVKAGLARVVDWSAQFTDAAPLLRAAEAGAKSMRLNLWQGYVAPNAGPGMGEYQARVVEVVGPDVLVVTTAPPGTPNAEEKRVYLSSVKAPRPGNERKGDKGEPFSHDAREWMRKNAVGKKVRVVPEYQRKLPAQEASAGGDGAPPTRARPESDRTYAAVFLGDRNLAVGLIGAGLAAVNVGRSDDRSAYFDDLVDAEKTAKEKKVGKHSGREGSQQLGPADCQDLTLPENRDRAKAFLPALQRDTRVRGTVLHVIHGARFKVLVPKEACIISVALAGVRCPSTARRDQPGSVSEPFADEAYALARHTLLQREVDLEIESLDKNGVFLGFVQTLDTKKNYAVGLLEAGLARRIPPAADRSRHALELEAAEASAVAARLRIWEGYEEAAAEDEEDAADGAATAAAVEGRGPPPLPEIDLLGTDVSDGVSFWAQPCGADDSAPRDARRVQETLAKAGAAPANGFTPKVGAPCAALFAADKAYYRAKVVSVAEGAESATVHFVDYGNSQVVPATDLRPLDPAVSLSAVPPLAMQCHLCYLVAQPVDEEAGEAAALFLSEAVLGRAVRARVERKQGNEAWLSVIAPEASSDAAGGSGSGDDKPTKPAGKAAKTINAELVKMGLARVEKRIEVRNAHTGPTLDVLRALQDEAKKHRLGMWRYGDVEEDDAKEFGYTPRNTENAWAKKK